MTPCGNCGLEGPWTLSAHPRRYCSRACVEADLARRRLTMVPRP